MAKRISYAPLIALMASWCLYYSSFEYCFCSSCSLFLYDIQFQFGKEHKHKRLVFELVERCHRRYLTDSENALVVIFFPVTMIRCCVIDAAAVGVVDEQIAFSTVFV